jgi:hypothetical protein
METDLINLGPSDSNPLDFSVFSSSPQNTTKEILEQQLHSLLDQSIWDLPHIYKDRISSSISNLDKFIKLSSSSSDFQSSSSILNHLRQASRDYDYQKALSTSMQKLWDSSIYSESQSLSSQSPKIDSLISHFYTVFGMLIETLNEFFINSAIKSPLFLPLNSYEDIFRACLKDLKTSATRKKLQMKLCPGVEPPKIKQVQRQFFKTIKKPFTEWNTFSIEKIVEIEQEPSCVMVPFLHRLMNYTNQTKAEVVTYTAPVGWEVTRISAAVTDGNFKEAIVTRTATRSEKGLVEVSVTYPKITKDHIWCKVNLEGIISQKSFQEIRVPEFKMVLVTVDEDGEHEILPEFLEEVDN